MYGSEKVNANVTGTSFQMFKVPVYNNYGDYKGWSINERHATEDNE